MEKNNDPGRMFDELEWRLRNIGGAEDVELEDEVNAALADVKRLREMTTGSPDTRTDLCRSFYELQDSIMGSYRDLKQKIDPMLVAEFNDLVARAEEAGLPSPRAIEEWEKATVGGVKSVCDLAQRRLQCPEIRSHEFGIA